MTKPVVVIGAGIGGLAAAAWLAKAGHKVLVVEARPGPGGLASAFTADGHDFDAGPYVLLDRPGLEWVFHELGEELSSHLTLCRIGEVYQVQMEDGPHIRVYGDLDRTSAELDQIWPGAGARYRGFAEEMERAYRFLQPMQYCSRPGVLALFRLGAWPRIPFLLQALSTVFKRAGLPRPLVEALAIWTRIAGQSPDEAPAPMAFVPALIHRWGAYYPLGGMGKIAETLEKIARFAGAEFAYRCCVRRITISSARVSGVETTDGQRIEARAVVSNAGGIATYLRLLENVPAAFKKRLEALPLQSPGVCAYLAAREKGSGPYLKFWLPQKGHCRLLVQPGLVDPGMRGTARLLGPVDHSWARQAGPGPQNAYLDALLQEGWWKEFISGFKVIARRTPAEWGAEFHLYDDSMNPVMTAKFMREGRLSHKSPIQEALYLAGSSTHPGQWVSFCAISGILAARECVCSKQPSKH